MSAKPLIEIEDLWRSFVHDGRELPVLKGISLSVEQGEMACIVGSSGTGKSTLLHLMGTLDLPTSGSIRYFGKDVCHLSSAKLAAFRNKSLGFVFQFHHLLPEFTALENVMMPGYIQGEAKKPLTERARKLLYEVGLTDRIEHRPSELSGGEQQRVALARALVMNPKMVLADEPTGNLDTQTSEAIHQLLFRLNEERGTTFLIVTHNRDLAAMMPRVISMKDGCIESDRRSASESLDAQLPETPSSAEDDLKIQATKAEVDSDDETPIRSDA